MNPALSGVLLVDKPAGLTSADVTNQLKRAHKPGRIGHGGTLDPFATGLLVVLLGEATKAARFLLEGEKEYEAEAVLGIATDTGDPTGSEVGRSEVPSLSLAQWQEHAGRWTGFITQTPPAYSAVKVNGRPLYDYARKGEEVAAKPREVQVHELAVLAQEGERLRFRVRCSGGTYIRVLAHDLAREAGSVAHLASLRRTGSSAFRVADALPLAEALARPATELPIRSLTEALAHLPRVNANPVIAQKVRHGNLAACDVLIAGLAGRPGYFLVVEENSNAPIAICNHHPMMLPHCTIERVFDPHLVRT